MTFTTPNSWGSPALKEAWTDLQDQIDQTRRLRRRRWLVWSGKDKTVASASETSQRPTA